MEKKEYIKPKMTVYQIKAPTILAGSNIKIAEEGDYDNVAVSYTHLRAHET